MFTANSLRNAVAAKAASQGPASVPITQEQLNQAVLLVRDAVRIESCAANVTAELGRDPKQAEGKPAQQLKAATEGLSAALDRMPPAELEQIRERVSAMAAPLSTILRDVALPEKLRTSTAAAVSFAQLHSPQKAGRKL